MPLLKSEQKCSYADYLTWDENERWEILDGVPYMQAAPSRIHQEVSMELSTQFHTYLSSVIGVRLEIFPFLGCFLANYQLLPSSYLPHF